MSSRTGAFLGLAGLSALAGCNALFNITPGTDTGGGGTTSQTGGGGTTMSTGGSTGGTSTGGSTGGTTMSTDTTMSTGGGGAGACSGAGAPNPTGKAYQQRFSNSYGYETGRAAAFDPAGNLILAGTIGSDQVDFGGGALPYSGATIYPNEALFVAKLDPSAGHLASRSFSATGTARLRAMAVDPATSEIVIAGEFLGDLQIGAAVLSSFELDYDDMFLAKLAPDLTPLWAKKYGKIYRQEPNELAVDSQGNIVVVGASYTKVDFGGGDIGGDQWNAFVVKFDPSGAFVWNQYYPGFDVFTANGEMYFNQGLALAANDDVIVGGTFGVPVFFGGSQVFPKGGRDAYVVRLAAADKTLVWKATFDGGAVGDADGDQWVDSLSVDPCGDLYVAGAFTKQMSLDGQAVTPVKGSDPAVPDMFLMKLDSAGAPVWQKAYGDAGWQEAVTVRTDPFGNVALSGFLSDGPGYTGVDFGPGIGVLGPNVPDPAPSYLFDGFVVKLGPDGTGLWGHRLGDGDLQWVYAAAFDKKGQLAIAGSFGGTMVLDASQTPMTALGHDVFAGWFDKGN